MNNVITKLKSTKIFPNDSKMKDAIETFATLPFKEAIQKLFKPFMEEQIEIFDKNDLDRSRLHDDDPITVIKKFINVISQSKVYGKLFHMSTIVGAVHEIKNGTIPLNDKNEASNEIAPIEERNKIFHQLLCAIGEFLQLYLSHGSNSHPLTDGLEVIMGRILEICDVIAIDLEGTDLHLTQYKKECLSNLSECCRKIHKCYKNNFSIKNIVAITRLNLDLLSQAQTLLIRLMSEGQIVKEVAKSVTVNRDMLDIVFKSILNDLCPTDCDDGFTIETLLNVKKKTLEVIGLTEWPLTESYLEYATSIIKTRPNLHIVDESISNRGPCKCVAISPEFIINRVNRLPQSALIENFTNEVLPSQYGILMSEDTKRIAMETWTEHWISMTDVMEDGVTAVVDMQGYKMSRSQLTQATISDSQTVMEVISNVAILDDVCHATKWNELYRNQWGDVSQFVQDNVLLAMRFNVRIVETELGRIRINVTVNEEMVRDASIGLQTLDLHSFRKFSRRMVGLFVSRLVKTPQQPIRDNLIIQSTADAVTDCSERFSVFVEISLSIVSSEFVSDVFVYLLCPIAHILFDSEATLKLQSALACCSQPTILVLRQQHPDHLALQPVIQSKFSFHKEVLPQETKKEIPMDFETPEISEEFEIVKQIQVSEEVKIQEEEVEVIELPIKLTGTSEDENCRIVENIRRSEFGVGLEDIAFVTNFNKRMARLVDHFSSDLYANPTHFVIELIQNADDNRYQSNVRAHLELEWKHKNGHLSLNVVNNECGFSESDLRSLCDIGASTKSSHRPDKIGRKGIGFKSVFLVSDSPEVHSNGFHVRFNRYSIDEHNEKVANNALIPQWISGDSDIHDPSSTTIVLPIIATLTKSIQESVARQLDPSLLLFLRRLRRISIANGPSIETVDDECTGNRKVVITDQGLKHTWFMYTRPVNIDNPCLREISPHALSRTDITIAVPFDDQKQSRDMPAFAFLPIRSYGLRFIINADFTIPASREDITNNCPWNKWLIDQASDIFVNAVNVYLSTDTIAAANIAKFVDSVPLPGEVPSDSSFAIIVPKLRSSLSQLCWLPDHCNRLYSPSQLIIESNDDPLLIKILCCRLNMSFLHPSINGSDNDRRISVLKWLGCQQLSLSHLSSLLVTLTDSELSDGILIKSIIVAIHTSLHRETNITSINRMLSLLRTIKLWPVISQDNRVISLESSSMPIFLPPIHWTETSDQYCLLRRVISPSFITSFVSNNSSQVNPALVILRRLGVHDLSTKSMIDHALLPCLSRTNLSRQVIVQISQFLVEHCNPQQYKETVLPRLQFATVTHTTNGIYQTVTSTGNMSTVHLPLSLDDENVVSLLHNRISYVVVDDAYLSDSISSTQWTNFFLSAGVSRSFCSSTTNDTEITYPELTQLLALRDPHVNMELLRYLDTNWNVLGNVSNSTMIHTLSSSPWIPVSTSIDDVIQDPHQITLAPVTYLPSEVVYLSTDERHKSMIADSLLVYFPYCPVVFRTESLPRQLGMSSQVSSDHIVAFLQCALVDQSLSLTNVQCLDLYSWISHNLSKESLRSVFNHIKKLLNNELSLLLPGDQDTSELVPCGRCYWSIPLNQVLIQSKQVHDDLYQVFSDHHCNANQRPLVKLFPELKELFVDVLQVQEYPMVESISDILHSTLQSLTDDRLPKLNNSEVDLIADVYNVIYCLDDYHSQSCRNQINRMLLIPCLSGRYRSYNDYTDQFIIYSWKNSDNVVAFQECMANDQNPSADFLAVTCSSKKESFHNADSRNKGRLSVSQFLTHYFKLPVLEDHIRRVVTNRDQFSQCSQTKSMFDHVEVIVSHWIKKNMPSNSSELLSSISGFYRSDSAVYVTSTLLGGPVPIEYHSTHKVYIGAADNSYHLYIGALDQDYDGKEVIKSVMYTLAMFLLDGDSLKYLRDRFEKFYSSLLDLIETSDRGQVQIYIRSHNLRIQSSSTDYIYQMIAISNNVSSSLSEHSDSGETTSPADNAKTEDDPSSRKRPRISVENEVAAKQARLDTDLDSVLASPLARHSREGNSRPSTPVLGGGHKVQRGSRPATPARLDQISIRNMDSAYMSGRLGEQLANERLRSKLTLGQWDIVRMEWLNEHTESMLPYDFKLRATNRSSGLTETIYLEVKATTQPDKRQFHLSAQEVTAAWSNKAQYHLLLVFHGGSATTDPSQVTFVHIPDVLGQMQDHHCKLFIDLAAMLDD